MATQRSAGQRLGVRCGMYAKGTQFGHGPVAGVTMREALCNSCLSVQLVFGTS